MLFSYLPHEMDREVCLGFLYDDSIYKYYKKNQLPSLVVFAKRSLSAKKGKIALPCCKYSETTKEVVLWPDSKVLKYIIGPQSSGMQHKITVGFISDALEGRSLFLTALG